jgi:hypothetical protein
MKILLTPEQEKTLWNFQRSLVTSQGTYLYYPFYIKSKGDGEYECITFEQLPNEAKDQLLAKQGIKLPVE